MPRPFLKWAGGKSWLAPRIVEAYLRSGAEFYVEPFLGGGSVFFRLASSIGSPTALLNDLNHELISTYQVVRDDCDSLIAHLADLDNQFKLLPESERAHFYYRIRDYQPNDPIESSARFIFLNKTCYNGLFRVNRQGKFNVPYGRYANPTILDEYNLRRCSESLRNCDLFSADFADLLDAIPRKSFVYLDPPYVPLSPTSNFTNYTRQSFDIGSQLRLKQFFANLESKDCFALLSNSYNKFVLTLYAEYPKIVVLTTRSINSNGKKRGLTSELLIGNKLTSRYLAEIEPQPIFEVVEGDSLTCGIKICNDLF